MFLNLSADVIHSPGTIADHVEAVDDDLGVGEECSGNIAESLIHVHDHIFDIISIGEGQQVILNAGHSPVGEDVKNALCQRIRDDALELFTADVSLEFVEGDCRRKARRAYGGHVLETARDAADGSTGQGRDVLYAAAPAQQMHDLHRYLMREALIFSREGAILREALPTFRTHVSPSVVAQHQRLSTQFQVPNGAHAVIVNALGLRMAARTGMGHALHPKENFDLEIRFPDFIDLNPFHSEQF